MPSVDKDSPIAPWRQVAGFISEAIESGELAPGRRVPSEPEMVAAYGVSRNTVRKAVAFLVDAGRLFRSEGMGTYVKDDAEGAQPSAE